MSIENGSPFIFWLKVVAVSKYEVVQLFFKKVKVSFAIYLDFVIIDDSMIIPSKLA
jgi:hypothetical protein